MTGHVARARSELASSASEYNPLVKQQIAADRAVAEATLALVEEQRRANQIAFLALRSPLLPNETDHVTRLEAELFP